MRDFTLHEYRWLVENLLRLQVPVFGVLAWCHARPQRGFLVRHDVDRKPANAFEMARLEADMGIATTYYFRAVGSAYNPAIIQQIAAMGHEVGYHYEDLALASGDLERAHSMFSEHLGRLRRLVDIQTIAMHGSPLSRFNNLDMWRQCSLSQYGLQADAFLTVDYTGVPYFTDTGRCWGAGAANLRDKPETANPPPVTVRSTRDLVAYVQGSAPQRLAMSAHPERWAHAELDWWLQLAKDRGVNGVKRVLRAIR